MNKVLLLIGLICGIVGITVGTIGLVAATSESEDEKESDSNDASDDAASSSTTEGGVGEEECTGGPSMIKGLMGNGSSNPDPVIMDMYNDALRTEEIKTYIAENVDKFDIPDWMFGTSSDSTSTFCWIASAMVEQEKSQGIRFEGSDLDDNIGLRILKKQGDIVSSVLENQQ
jgi:hypothetical protein